MEFGLYIVSVSCRFPRVANVDEALLFVYSLSVLSHLISMTTIIISTNVNILVWPKYQKFSLSPQYDPFSDWHWLSKPRYNLTIDGLCCCCCCRNYSAHARLLLTHQQL